MAMDASEIWRHCFQNWPEDVCRRGVLVTSFGEQIAFDNFAASDHMLLIERRRPTRSARTVLIAYQHIQAFKIVDVVKAKSFQSLGFPCSPAEEIGRALRQSTRSSSTLRASRRTSRQSIRGAWRGHLVSMSHSAAGAPHDGPSPIESAASERLRDSAVHRRRRLGRSPGRRTDSRHADRRRRRQRHRQDAIGPAVCQCRAASKKAARASSST